jgi:hypothetical protein
MDSVIKHSNNFLNLSLFLVFLIYKISSQNPEFLQQTTAASYELLKRQIPSEAKEPVSILERLSVPLSRQSELGQVPLFEYVVRAFFMVFLLYISLSFNKYIIYNIKT